LGYPKLGFRTVANRGLAMVTLVTKSVFTKKYDRFRLMMIEARQSADLTQSELAKKLSRPQSFVSKYERGERRLDVVEFLELARALGIDAVKFIKKVDNA
jgi:ribosome-binding protein aMBF1 (putative translation factor)